MTADELISKLRGERTDFDAVSALGGFAGAYGLTTVPTRLYVKKLFPAYGEKLVVPAGSTGHELISPESMRTYDDIAANLGIKPISTRAAGDVVVGTDQMYQMDNPSRTKYVLPVTVKGRPFPRLQPDWVMEQRVRGPGVLPGHVRPLDEPRGARLLMGSMPNDIPIIAHELGHMKTLENGNKLTKLIMALRTPGMLGLSLGAMSAAGLSDQENAGIAAAGGTISAAPLLADEVGASLAGYRGLRAARPDISRLRALRAFAGVPSYVAAASTPVLAYLLSRKLREQRGYS